MLTILIIDKSSADSLIYSQWLSKFSMRVIHAENAEDGIVLSKTQLPDVIITDIEFPGMSGFQAIRQLKSSDLTKSIPIIILSDKLNPINQTWGLRQGANFCLTKPIAENELVSRIQTLLPGEEAYVGYAFQN